MTRQQVIALRNQLDGIIDQVNNDHGESLGCRLRLGSCKFGATAEFKLECQPLTDSGEVVTKEAEDFKRYASLYQLEPTDLGRKFRYAGQEVEITGMAVKSRKYPILGKGKDGQVRKYTSETVRACLK